jgi:hypothetical protein
LGPAPDSRSRGARPHLSRSFTARILPPFLLPLQHTIVQRLYNYAVNETVEL